jgi:hypothetical protein
MKALKIAASLCLLALVGAVLVFYLKLNIIIKTAVETLGPKITGTEVRLGSASVSPFSGSGSLKGLFIGNPKGFKSEGAFSMRKVAVGIDLKSLKGGPIVVREILVEGPEVTYEQTMSGNNIMTLKRNVESAAARLPQSSSKSPPRKIIIEDFTFRDGKVKLAIAGQALTVPLPPIHLKDIGKKQGGVTPDQAAGAMFSAVTSSVLQAAGGASKELVKAGEQQLKKGSQLLKGLLKR